MALRMCEMLVAWDDRSGINSNRTARDEPGAGAHPAWGQATNGSFVLLADADGETALDVASVSNQMFGLAPSCVCGDCCNCCFGGGLNQLFDVSFCTRHSVLVCSALATQGLFRFSWLAAPTLSTRSRATGALPLFFSRSTFR